MTEEDFKRAAFDPPHRPKLLAQLMADPVLLARARARVAVLTQMHERGQVFDRDHISKMEYETLGRMLKQVDANKQEQPTVKVQ